MTDVGPNACGTGSNVDDGGTRTWSNPTYIQVDDTNYASTSELGLNQTSQALYAQNFGFAIDAGVTISNVSFSYKRKAASASNFLESSIKILNAAGSPAGSEKADAVTYWANSDETITKSGDATYWGLTLTPALVNDADFGLKIKASRPSGAGNLACYVQYVSCTVTYTTASGMAVKALYYARLRSF